MQSDLPACLYGGGGNFLNTPPTSAIPVSAGDALRLDLEPAGPVTGYGGSESRRRLRYDLLAAEALLRQVIERLPSHSECGVTPPDAFQRQCHRR